MKYAQGLGIDIGCGDDPLTNEVERWDTASGQGDATLMAGVPINTYDYVYASHLLEHLDAPQEAVRNWWRILKPWGWLIIVVPHRDLYEKRALLPSRFNPDHKHFWVPLLPQAPHTLGLLDTVTQALDGLFVFESLRVIDEGFEYVSPTVHSNGEYSIELIIRK